MNTSCPISVIIPTWQRKQQLSQTLEKILACRPYPSEILVHVDAGDEQTEPWLHENFPDIITLKSLNRMGPGGGRNKLIAAATCPIVASFDDDSYPLNIDYFDRLTFCFKHYPDMSALASQIIEINHPVPEARRLIGISSHFGGGGVAYQRKDFLSTGGYIPLAIAYGMEEVDLCIRFVNMQKKIYFSPWLQVFHNSTFSHHQSSTITSAMISNLALLAYLRYPKRYWPYGALQVINRILWLSRAKRFSGIVTGLIQVPFHLWQHKHLRQAVSSPSLQNFFRIRNSPRLLEPLPD